MIYKERRYLVVATRHYGKTTFVVSLAAQIERDPGVTWTLAYVVQHDATLLYTRAGYREARTLKAVRKLMRDGAPRIMVRPPVTPGALVDYCVECRRRLDRRHLTLIIDELFHSSIITSGADPVLKLKHLEDLVAVERGCNLIMGTQFPASIPMSVRQLCEEWHLGRVVHDAALVRLRNCAVPPALLRELPTMGLPGATYADGRPKRPYEFLHWQSD